MCRFNGLFNSKLWSVLNLIFVKSLPCSPSLPPYIVLISFLIPSQSSVYFSHTSLFLSVESKTKYLLPLFSSICPSTSPIIRFKRIYTVNIFIIITLFKCDVSNVININVSVRLFADF